MLAETSIVIYCRR